MIRIKLFGVVKDAAGQAHIDLEADGLESIGLLERHLFDSYPEIKRYRDFIIFLKDSTVVQKDTGLRDGDTVTVMIPTSGG